MILFLSTGMKVGRYSVGAAASIAAVEKYFTSALDMKLSQYSISLKFSRL
jgi:hypothetical protein